MGSENNDVSYWKGKYEELEKKLAILQPLAADGVSAYDELLKKYECNQFQYKKLQEKSTEKDLQLSQMKNLLEPVYNEYDELQTKYDIETTCRVEVENYANRLTKENKVLRRQSQAYLSQTGGLVPVEKEPDTYKEHSDKMNSKIKELESEITELKRRLREHESDAITQRERADKGALRIKKTSRELEQTKKNLRQHEKALQELANCSEVAYDEYQNLRKKHDLEVQCRSKAEEYASKMYVQTEAMKRQSSILLMSVASDEKLFNALHAVEEANEKLEELKQQHTVEVKTIKEELDETAKYSDRVTALEEEVSKLESDNESLQKKLEDFNSQYTALTSKYNELEDKYETITRPPPPPPLPVSFVQTKKNVTDIIKDRKLQKDKKLAQSGVKQNDGYAKAIDEMMNRIKGGQRILNPTTKTIPRRTGSLPDETDSSAKNCAMDELQNIFKKIKRSRSDPDLLSVTSDDGNNNSAESTPPVPKIRGNTPPVPKIRGNNSPKSGPTPALSSLKEERESQISINKEESNPVF